MREAVITRLSTLGHTVEARELEQVDLAIEQAREEICRATNTPCIPDGMQGVLLDRACRYFLSIPGEVKRTETVPGAAKYRKVVW